MLFALAYFKTGPKVCHLAHSPIPLSAIRKSFHSQTTATFFCTQSEGLLSSFLAFAETTEEMRCTWTGN